MKVPNCPFCGTDRGPVWAEPATDWHLIENRVLASAGQVSLCAGLGAIVEPYVIAFTKEHYTAISELDASTRSDVMDALDLCMSSGAFPSGSLTVFEHGGRSLTSHAACLEHSHLHIIDGNYGFQACLARYPEARQEVISEDSSLVAKEGYLFAGSYGGTRVIRGILVQKPSCESQFFRRLLASQVGSVQWDWRLSPRPEAALALCRRWRKSSPVPPQTCSLPHGYSAATVNSVAALAPKGESPEGAFRLDTERPRQRPK